MISYVKNNLLNQEILIDKMKPYTEIRGIGKVQIFNSKTGEIEVESVSENVVTYAQSIVLYYNFFISYICGIGITQNNFIPKIDADPFKNIYIAQLTNQGVEPVQEDPFQIRVPITHRVRGYADRYLPYSGGDTSRGTINVAETKFYKEGNDFIVHFVFDFPTHAGNGDFDCIYWANDSYSRAYELDTITFNTGKQFNNFADVIPMEDSRNDNILIAVCTDKETVADNKIKYKLSRIYVFDKDMNFLFYRDMEQYINSLPMNSTIVFNMRSDGKIALIDNTNQKIHLYDYEMDSVVQTMNVSGLGIDKCMVYEGDYLYICNVKSGDTTKDEYTKFLVSEEQGLKSIWTVEENTVTPWALKVQDGKIMGKYKDYSNQIWVDVSENVRTVSTNISVGGSYYKNYQNVRKNNMNIKVSSKTDSDGRLILEVTRRLIGFMGAFNKLPSRLTKTETNTMKIQYDFRFEDPMNKILAKEFS